LNHRQSSRGPSAREACEHAGAVGTAVTTQAMAGHSIPPLPQAGRPRTGYGFAGRLRWWGKLIVADHAPFEDQLHVIGPADVQILADHFLEENPTGSRLVQDLGQRELCLED
jgi:hypothetical protein